MSKQIQIDNLQRKYPFPRELSSAMRACAQTALKRAAAEEGEIYISMIGPRQIRMVNAEYRQIDAVTDVLSFPQIEWENALPGQLTSLSQPPERNLDTGRIMLGDILICMERAHEQAEQYGHSLKRELCFLTVHGVLHLLGYDHVTSEGEKEMNALCESVLEENGVFRTV
ncbi:MAG: rRNA maturation RNase YbeY [Clostridia bacterium]|nr:rRNA maturation RNase YbeY [Clostridia bacterium]